MHATDTTHADIKNIEGRYNDIYQKLELLFNEIITIRTDDAALKRQKVIASDLSIENWDWSQGVGIYGVWRLHQVTGEQRYLDYILAWYQRRLAEGLPEKNINRMAPMLTLATMSVVNDTHEHEALINEYAHWIEHQLPRTQENGFTHCTSDHPNEEQLWVDTLFMSGLFYARAGIYLGKPAYLDEISYQFLLHIKYLIDRETGLWMHGWNFTGDGNYGKALWGRGNGWAAISTVDFLEMLDNKDASYQMILSTFRRQADAALRYQDVSGMWRTLLDQPDSYLEASGTAGFTYALLKGIRLGLLDERYRAAAWNGVNALLSRINPQGEVADVSAGTSVGFDLDHYRKIAIKQRTYGQSLTMLALTEALAVLA
ncbi:glycoside hydrolase family 88 protein [Pectobacterium cacticida]|uniref:Glycoside hydrolase family 88 protein n=1 Tax=Pectobacterium cacticida TaxID=69221 RepID=A0ABZ2G829_9GAMM|nr:glycoside hydrolase family 88 protein [Pectobacterium cacticida]UYX08420.1 glycoside hydrolase family 88 protein [Pectobacterium cacticida]